MRIASSIPARAGSSRSLSSRKRARKPSQSSPSVGSDLVPVGRVGKPHGLDGAFFVEGPSGRKDVFADGATLYADGEPATVVASRRGSGGRPVIRLDRHVERGTELAVARETLPQLGDDAEFSVFPPVGVGREGESRRLLGRVRE